MSDLISRQAAIKAIEDLQDCYNGFSDTYDKACIIGVIEEVPPIEPVKHGQWKHHQYGNTAGYYECDMCGKINSYESNYCPNCGADMREVEDPYSADQTWAEYTLKE